VTLVAAKPTEVTGVGPFGMPMACGFCDITHSMAVGTWAQKHGGGNTRACFSNLETKQLTANHLQQFTVGKHDGYEYLPISNLQGWQYCVVSPTASAPGADAASVAVAPTPALAVEDWVKAQRVWKSKKATKADWLQYSKQNFPDMSIEKEWKKEALMQHVMKCHAKKYGTEEEFPDIAGFAKRKHE